MNLKAITKPLGMIIIALLTAVPFALHNGLYNGTNMAKELALFTAVAFILVYLGSIIINASFKVTLPDILVLSFVLFSILPYIIGKAPNGQHKCHMYLAGLVLYYFGKTLDGPVRDTKVSLQNLLLAFLMLSATAQAVLGLLQLYGLIPSLNSMAQITGTFVNTPMFAMYLGAIFPIAAYFTIDKTATTDWQQLQIPILKRCVHLGKAMYFLAMATLVSILLVLPVTLNRASWVMVITGTITILILCGTLRNNTLFHRVPQTCLPARQGFHSATRRIVITLTTIVLAGGLTGAYLLKKDSADGRLFIYGVAAKKAIEKPLFGQGTGSFEAQYNNWQAAWFQNNPEAANGREGWLAGNVKFAYNEYLEILTENGVIGLILFLAFVILLISTKDAVKLGVRLSVAPRVTNPVPKDSKALSNKQQNTLSIPVKASFVGLLAAAMVSYPFRSAPTFLLFFLYAGIISNNKQVTLRISGFRRICRDRFARKKGYALVPLKLLSSCFLIASAVYFTYTAHQQYKNYWHWDEARLFYNINDYELAAEAYEALYPKLKNNGEFLLEYGKVLQLTEEHEKSIEIIEHAKPYISDIFMHTNLGDAYKAVGNYKKAEQAYDWSRLMVPHRMYPEYLMANMHAENGDTTKAKQLAQNILNKKIKVPSQAVEEIREEMTQIINKVHGL